MSEAPQPVPAPLAPPQPLSQRLEALLANHSGQANLTLNMLLQRTEGRGVFLLIILLCLPFVAPASVPGMSPPLGTAIAIMALGLIRRGQVRLPRRVGDRVLTERVRKVILNGGLKVLRILEKVVKPRKSEWLRWPAVHVLNVLLIVLAALLLALPLPPVPPLTNFFPSYTIIFLAASMMEEDGVMIWVGYVLSLWTTLYIGWCFTVYWSASHQVFHWLDTLLRKWGVL
ncbi:MAG: exopolysaccharide biosynthesis protein [Verrucomicrobiota bacterium]